MLKQCKQIHKVQQSLEIMCHLAGYHNKTPVTSQITGVHDLFVNMRSGLLMYIDWIKFIE